jgi:sugar-phosphatase
MIEAVIFDMDGVLVDSEPFWQRAEVTIFGQVGVDITPADTDKTIGLRIDDVVAYWFEQRPWNGRSVKEVQEAIVAEVVRLVREEGDPMPGVNLSLASCAHNGLALGLATSSPFSLIDAILEKIGAERTFDVVCSAVNEEFGKPHPAVYLTAARRLGVTPEHCLVVEDSIFGTEAGKAAGMSVVAVPAAYQYDESAFEIADHKLRSLEQFPGLLERLLLD